MPEIYDIVEVERLLEDASALVAEMRAGDRPAELPSGSSGTGPPTTAEEMPDDLSPDMLVFAWGVLDRGSARKNAYDNLAGLWLMVAEGIELRDMAKIRNAHAGIRTVVMEQLASEAGGEENP